MTSSDAANFRAKSGIRVTRRLPLSKPTRSYIGGIPMLPDPTRWPTFPGEDVSIPFAAQIDLSELPRIQNDPLPSHGVLFFFFGTSNKKDTPAHRVIYATECGASEAVLPGNLIPLGDYGHWSPSPFEWKEIYYPNRRFPPEDALFARPKYELQMDLAVTFNHPVSRNSRPWEESQAFYEKIGIPMPSGPNIENWYRSPTNWPWAWIIVELIVRRKFRERERHFVVNKINDAAVRERHYQEAHRWLERAIEAGRFTPMTAAQSHDFTRWLFGLYLSEWKSRGHSEDRFVRVVPERHPTLLLGDVASITKAAISLLLDARQPNRNLLSESIVQSFMQFSTAEPEHQVLGYGKDSQHPPPNHHENVLLLQLDTDYGAMMLWNDCDALQFCISEADLQRGTFEHSYCWMSG